MKEYFNGIWLTTEINKQLKKVITLKIFMEIRQFGKKSKHLFRRYLKD